MCFWQWFGSRLQLTPHLHVLLPEGLWQQDEGNHPPWAWTTATSACVMEMAA